ncbi:MAG: diacylglycerol kinase family lipid kinase, partial [Clostridia bacterium]|nr:diacylglycerol kinase family lipid kinase [Clostridia bacterium]
WYGGGFKATPTANVRDGLIDFIAIPTMSRLQFLKYVGDYKKGEHMETMKEYLFYRRCKKVRFLAPKPVVIQADGEIFQLKDPEIEIVPGALNLILPRPEHPHQ